MGAGFSTDVCGMVAEDMSGGTPSDLRDSRAARGDSGNVHGDSGNVHGDSGNVREDSGHVHGNPVHVPEDPRPRVGSCN